MGPIWIGGEGGKSRDSCDRPPKVAENVSSECDSPTVTGWVVSRGWWKLGGAGTEGPSWGGSGGEVKVGG